MATATRQAPFFMEISHGHYLLGSTGYVVEDRVTHYDVLKMSNDGNEVVEVYTVRNKAGKSACSCPDHRFRGRECKHARLVNEYRKNW